MAKDPIYEETAPSRVMAEQVAKWLGCSGAHRVGDLWAPCESADDLRVVLSEGKAGLERRRKQQAKRLSKPNRIILQPEVEIAASKKRRRYYTSGWEYLRERGIHGIDTLPGGGLVSKN